MTRRILTSIACLVVLATMSLTASAQQFNPSLFGEMRWRNIGPFRAGRTRPITGVPGQPNAFYIGVHNGGVWKTTDYGRTWKPIFDEQPTGSVGAIAVAPSDPNIVYVGSGEGLQRPDLSVGDGIYKSTDAGKTWTHLGLRDGQQIPEIIVDPRNPNRLFVAVLGHPYGANEERGIFRSSDGGQTFQKVLYKDENTGGFDLEFDPSNPQIVYATLWEARQGPWENGAWSGTTGGIFKSTDGGTTWNKLTKGLPADPDGVVLAEIAVAPSNPQRLYAVINSQRGAGIYSSDDAGENWTKTTTDTRPLARLSEESPTVDPKNPDIIYVATVVCWKSTDGGKTWTAFKGAPGGDDYQRAWINPTNPSIIALASDQGAVISVNGGESWSSWYNQPTAQMYHITADNAFPYRLCSGQQESGSACVPSRGDDGQITFREWRPVAVEEYGYVAPDPLNPDIVYGGKVTRYDRRSGQTQNVTPKPIRPADFRTLRTAPLVFSTVDPHVLFFGANTVWKTINGGMSWQQVSPDLTRKTFEVPANIGKYRSADTARATQRGVVYTIAPSYVDINRIWAGTDDGLIHTTADGGLHWTDVTPPQVTPFAKVSIMDAGRFDALTAYAAVNTIRLDDMRPHIYRTRDGGKSWTEITNGIPAIAPVNVVREDPRRKGLLFAGTEREVYVSFDDGENWQSLRLNMPATSIRDLIIKDDDVAVGTHGRGFWILDDITPLRQLNQTAAAAEAVLFKPQTTYRFKWNKNTDTPLPPDEPAGQNPPDGAIINYLLKLPASGPVTIEILDVAGKLVRRYSSDDPVQRVDPNTFPVPLYWVRPPQSLSATAGMHRFMWDLHYAPIPGGQANYPIAATFMNTAPTINSPWVAAGQYTVKLTVNGKSYTQPLTVKMDPRVKTTAEGLAQQFTLSKALYDGSLQAQSALRDLRELRTQLRTVRERAGSGPVAEAVQAFDERAAALEGAGGGGQRGGGAPAAARDSLSNIGGSLGQLLSMLQVSDTAPSTQLSAAVADRRAALAGLMSRWNALKGAELTALNVKLSQAGLPNVGK